MTSITTILKYEILPETCSIGSLHSVLCIVYLIVEVIVTVCIDISAKRVGELRIRWVRQDPKDP